MSYNICVHVSLCSSCSDGSVVRARVCVHTCVYLLLQLTALRLLRTRERERERGTRAHRCVARVTCDATHSVRACAVSMWRVYHVREHHTVLPFPRYPHAHVHRSVLSGVAQCVVLCARARAQVIRNRLDSACVQRGFLNVAQNYALTH